MELDDVLDDGQPETETGEASLGSLGPPVEYERQKLGGDPFAGVTDLDDPERTVARQSGFDQPTRRGVFDGIGQNIRDHLTQPRRVTIDDDGPLQILSQRDVLRRGQGPPVP